VAETDIHTKADVAPAMTDPLVALLVASFCVTTLLFVLTEHFVSASAALAAYSAAWCIVRRA